MKLIESSGCPALNCPESHQVTLSHNCCRVCKGKNILYHNIKFIVCESLEETCSNNIKWKCFLNKLLLLIYFYFSDSSKDCLRSGLGTLPVIFNLVFYYTYGSMIQENKHRWQLGSVISGIPRG